MDIKTKLGLLILVFNVNHDWICSWNQPVLSNESKVFCSRKTMGTFDVVRTQDRPWNTRLRSYVIKQFKIFYEDSL